MAAPPVMAPTAAPAPPPKAELPPDPTSTVAGARDLLERWKKANHFEVLGITEKATAAELKAAYFAHAKRLHPDTVVDPTQGELKALKAELISRVNEANAVLGDERARSEYLDELGGGGEKVDIGPILQAEEDFLRATILVKARKYSEALELLEKAIVQNASEGEFYAWRAWARFTQSKDKRAAYDECIAECTKALKMNPHCAAGQLFVGHMNKIVGDMAKAKRAYEACIAIDPNHNEARSELRLINARNQ